MFEKISGTQIIQKLLTEKLLSTTRFSFRTSYAKNYAISFIVEQFRKSNNTNSFVSCSLLDLSKAFDSFDHNHLRKKLKQQQTKAQPETQNFPELAIDLVIIQKRPISENNGN